jgi:hypothetical protein
LTDGERGEGEREREFELNKTTSKECGHPPMSFFLHAQVSEAEGSQLGSEHKAMFREISVSESPGDLTEAINMAVIESLPSTEFLSQV